MADLNDLVPAQPGIVLTHAMDINDDGVITGRALNSVSRELLAYVATPVAGSQLVLRRHAKPSGALSRQGQAVDVELPADVMRQILSPFGPGPERLRARETR